jgi:SAM-dependent methyltransferase
LNFDEHSADYSRQVNRALEVAGLPHDFFFEAKVRHILEVRNRLPESAVRVLEIGSGVGLLQQRLRPQFSRVWGIDPSIASLAAAPADRPEDRGIAADGLRLPFADESFHLVIAVCVLHHVAPDRWAAFLAEAARVLRRGGILTICEHNPWNPLTRLVVNRCEFDRDAVLLSLAESKGRLAAAGFAEIESRYIHFFPWRGTAWRRLERLLGPIPFGGQYVVDASRH